MIRNDFYSRACRLLSKNLKNFLNFFVFLLRNELFAFGQICRILVEKLKKRCKLFKEFMDETLVNFLM